MLLLAVITAIIMFAGCTSDSIIPEPSETGSKTLTTTEITVMNNFTPENKITNELCSLLGCSERTAESVHKNIARIIGKAISSVTADTDDIGTKLTVTDENGDIFIVFMGKGYLISEIYRGSEEGERIYFAME